jgi:hypothetical protein
MQFPLRLHTWLAVLLLVLLSMSLSQAAQPWKEPEGFRGLKWGSSPIEAQELFPTVRFAFPLMDVGPIELFTGKNQQMRQPGRRLRLVV